MQRLTVREKVTTTATTGHSTVGNDSQPYHKRGGGDGQYESDRGPHGRERVDDDSNGCAVGFVVWLLNFKCDDRISGHEL